MSPAELTAYIKTQTEPMLKQHGIAPVRGVQPRMAGNKRVAT
jgi:hypothetical protein